MYTKCPAQLILPVKLYPTLPEIDDFSVRNMLRVGASNVVLPDTTEAAGREKSLREHQN